MIAATFATFAMWERRYRELPSVPLTTEIDIEATRRRRSKRHPPGHCYLEAGWAPFDTRDKQHGRSAKIILTAASVVPWLR